MGLGGAQLPSPNKSIRGCGIVAGPATTDELALADRLSHAVGIAQHDVDRGNDQNGEQSR